VGEYTITITLKDNDESDNIQSTSQSFVVAVRKRIVYIKEEEEEK